MSSVPWNRDIAPIGVLLGGTGRIRVLTTQPATVCALMQSWPCTSSCRTAVCVSAVPAH